MSQIKQILRLAQQGKSIKFIVRNLSVSRNTVRKYLALGQASGRSLEELLKLEDDQLGQLLMPAGQAADSDRQQTLASQYEYFCKELRRTGVTRWLLWSEYRQSHPDGYSYSQFCWHLSRLDDARRVTMANLPHPPGEQTYIDFAGKYAEYVDPATGQIQRVPVLLLTLGCSQYSYVEALPSQTGEDFIDGLNCGVRWIGGVTKVLIPDNMKTAVVKTDRYEPGINRLLEDFANHYQTVILPARPAAPRDKSLVETAVRDVYRHVFAPLRNRRFFSLAELNQAIREQLEIWHNRPFQRRSETRRQRFDQLERPALQPLPKEPFVIKKPASRTVRNNSHIELAEDKHYYSVPHGYIKQKVKILYTTQLVQIFCRGSLIASHQRDRTPHGYTTVKEHLPSHHQHWMDRGPGWYRSRANRISPEVGQLVERILTSRAYPEQAFRSCDGVLGLHRKVGSTVLTEAARIALELDCCTYSYVNRLIKNGMASAGSTDQPLPAKLPDHDNIRGKDYFQHSLNL